MPSCIMCIAYTWRLRMYAYTTVIKMRMQPAYICRVAQK